MIAAEERTDMQRQRQGKRWRAVTAGMTVCARYKSPLQPPTDIRGRYAVQDHQIRLFEDYPAIGCHGVGQPDVAADYAVVADARLAPQNGGVGIYSDMVLQLRVPFVFVPAPQQTLLILGQRVEGAQGYAVVERHLVPDDGGLTDHHAGTMIDEKRLADGRARMDVNARAAVRDLGHHARNERHIEKV